MSLLGHCSVLVGCQLSRLAALRALEGSLNDLETFLRDGRPFPILYILTSFRVTGMPRALFRGRANREISFRNGSPTSVWISQVLICLSTLASRWYKFYFRSCNPLRTASGIALACARCKFSYTSFANSLKRTWGRFPEGILHYLASPLGSCRAHRDLALLVSSYISNLMYF